MVVIQPASRKENLALSEDSQMCAGGPSNGCKIWESGWRRGGAVNQSPGSPNVFLIRVNIGWDCSYILMEKLRNRLIFGMILSSCLRVSLFPASV